MDRRRLARLFSIALLVFIVFNEVYIQSLLSAILSIERYTRYFAVIETVKYILIVVLLSIGFVFRSSFTSDFKEYRRFITAGRDPEGNESSTAAVLRTFVIATFYGLVVLYLLKDLIMFNLSSGFPVEHIIKKHIFPLILVLAGWALWGAVFVGIGLFSRRLFGLRTKRLIDLIISFWMGWAFSIVILQYAHFLVRVGPSVTLAVCAFGLACLIANARDLWTAAKRPTHHFKSFYALLLLSILVLANRAINPPLGSDAGLYEFTALQWIQTYPIVPGLGNLAIQLSYNNTSFLYISMLDQGPWDHMAHITANYIFLAALLAQMLLSLFEVWRSRDETMVYHLFNIMLIPTIIRIAVKGKFSSPAPDQLLYALGIFLLSLLIAFLCRKAGERRDKDYMLLSIIFIGAAGVTVKLSFSALGVAIALVALVHWIRFSERRPLERVKTLIWPAILVCLLIVPWFIRNVMLGGYLVLPGGIWAFDVEWRVPKENATSALHSIAAFTRDPTRPGKDVLADWSWLGPWFKNMIGRIYNFSVPMLISLGSAAVIFFAGKRGPRDSGSGKYLPILIPPLASLLFWFFSAPSIVFAGSAIWTLSAGTSAIAIHKLWSLHKDKLLRVIIAVIILWISCFTFAYTIAPGLNMGAYKILGAKTNPGECVDGLIVNIPADDNMCWDSPIPCTTIYDENLRLLKPGDLGSGFATKPE